MLNETVAEAAVRYDSGALARRHLAADGGTTVPRKRPTPVIVSVEVLPSTICMSRPVPENKVTEVRRRGRRAHHRPIAGRLRRPSNIPM